MAWMRARGVTAWMAATATAAVFAVALSGCLPIGYQKMRPGETDVYSAYVADLVDLRAPGSWSWVRGRIGADFDGDLSYGEEAVVVTMQDGSPDRPGPIRLAVLLFCRLDDTGKRSLVAREVVYDRRRLDAPPASDGVVMLEDAESGKTGASAPTFVGISLAAFEDAEPPPAPEKKNIAVIIKPKNGEKEADGQATSEISRGMAVVSLVGPETPTGQTVWHLGYGWPKTEGEGVRPLFRAWVRQETVGVWFINRAPRASLLVAQQVLPATLTELLPESMPKPEWLSVWGVEPDGVYRQSDEEFANQYRSRVESWLAAYARWVHRKAAPAELAYCEYYIGRMMRLLGDRDQAMDFLTLSAENARSPELKEKAAAELARLKLADS